MPIEDSAGVHVYHQYTVLHPERDRLARGLAQRGVASGSYYRCPLHRQPAFSADAQNAVLQVTESVAAGCLSLPLCPELEEAQVDYVVSAALQ